MGAYETLNHISAYEILAASGALCELVGFLWIIAGVSQALSEDYEDHDLPHRIWFGIKHVVSYVFEEPPKRQVVSHNVSISAGATASATVSAVVRKDSESDIERLERELRELRAEVAEHKSVVEARFSGVEQRFSGVEQSIRAASDALEQRAAEIEQRLNEIHVTGLRKEKGGALLFLLGALLTLAAALI